MYCPFCWIVHIKYSLLLIGKSSPWSGGSKLFFVCLFGVVVCFVLFLLFFGGLVLWVFLLLFFLAYVRRHITVNKLR